MKAAVLQNSVGVGGRSKVLAKAIESLDENSYSVDIHTLTGLEGVTRFLNYYQIENVNVTGVSHRGSSVPSSTYQQPVLNFAVRDDLGQYDLVFNSNNCIRFLPLGPRYVHYVHFPTPLIPRVDPKYNQLLYRIASAPLTLLSSLTPAQPDGHVFTNSSFTLNYTEKAWDLIEPQVLYPPALESVMLREFTGEGVVSVGSFHPNKRQMFQLQIAKQFPNTKFRIIGSLASESYYKKCREYVADNGLDNVSLLTDISDQRLRDELHRSRVFIHTMENEHFGIAPAEGMNHGCIPVVHNSGGLREVVPDPEFRFNSMSECKAILDDVLSGSCPPIRSIKTHLEQFTEENFKITLSEHF
ncbi:glycosyltransferase [Halorubrum halodurans]|uniref:Glycosyl transferase family 1 domain-containing protein n=1 Tax=Halorubrum halodurans TaxID=1383851 RepID=A0A256ICE9_9EURY|nr:glycosyltransferase [Halorubrum halodurans]OYR54181.1 hypothetical protein DJ70_14570 [Halorubrum halodurans]